MKRVILLGSTGSIGRSTLEVVRALRGRVKVVGLAAATNIDRLRRQMEEFMPDAVCVRAEELADQLRTAGALPSGAVFAGEDGMVDLVERVEAELVVNAVVGAAGIVPTLAAIEAGRDVAIANKESLVAAGSVIVGAAERRGVNLLPVDSEHSAVFQCIKGERRSDVRRIVLTASGGPLIDKTAEEIAGVTASEALRHPTWRMGKKVTIDSATLLNKGFEVIEARWLFGIAADNIDVVIERNSIVHSLVEFVDGSVEALLSPPDMRLPIQYALTYPERADTAFSRLDLASAGALAFEEPDTERFPCLELAYDVARRGGTAGAVLSAADEIAVQAFLDGRIAFGDIHGTLKQVQSSHTPGPGDSLDSVLEADSWGRGEATKIVDGISGRG
jgi:1-deoxy-D-xylulose-5-phosphate reductoisomerase